MMINLVCFRFMYYFIYYSIKFLKISNIVRKRYALVNTDIFEKSTKDVETTKFKFMIFNVI